MYAKISNPKTKRGANSAWLEFREKMGGELNHESFLEYQQSCLSGNDESSGQMHGKRLLQAEEHQSRNLNEDLEVNAAPRDS